MKSKSLVFARCRPAFTLVELLVVIVVIGILMSLLLPAVQTSVAASRTAQCKSNQHQIGVALGNYLSTHNKAPDSITLAAGLQSIMEKQKRVVACPEVARVVGTTQAPSEISYGANECSHRMQRDAHKIVLMDAAEQTIEFQGQDSTEWLKQIRPRHSRQMNVLYFDGSVRLHRPEAIDPYTAEDDFAIREKYWKPLLPCDPNDGSSAGGSCGLLGKYYTGTWDGETAERVDNTLTMPYGANEIFGVPYSMPLPGGSASTSFPYRTGVWTGHIKAKSSEAYTFHVCCDNDAWLYVDGQLLCERFAGGWDGVQQYSTSSSLNMTVNEWVTIEVRNREEGPGSPSHLIIQWSTPSFPKEDIPCQNLRPD